MMCVERIFSDINVTPTFITQLMIFCMTVLTGRPLQEHFVCLVKVSAPPRNTGNLLEFNWSSWKHLANDRTGRPSRHKV